MATALMRGAWGAEPTVCDAYVAAVAGPAAEALAAAATACNGVCPAAEGGPADVALVCTLESLRGACQGLLPRTAPPAFALLAARFHDLLLLLRLRASHSLVALPLLRLCAALIEATMPFITASQASSLLQFASAVLAARVEAGAAASRQLSGKAAHRERGKEVYKEVKALLDMLAHVSSRDILDFGADEAPTATAAASLEQAAGDRVAEVVLRGLAAVLPLLTADLLLFPKLCRRYFGLLGHTLEVFSDRVAQLPPRDFGALLASLRFGLQHADSDMSCASLEAAGALASFHFTARRSGQPGLGAHAAPAADGAPGCLVALLEVVLTRVVFEESDAALTEAAADALLPLMLAESDAFSGFGQRLCVQAEPVGGSARVAAAMAALTDGVTASVDRPNRRKVCDFWDDTLLCFGIYLP